MKNLKIRIESRFSLHNATRVLQGEVFAGEEPQSTLLGSCVCIGFYYAPLRIGALSHITGYGKGGGHQAGGALHMMEKRLAKLGVSMSHCTCFVIGGLECVRYVLDSAIRALEARGIRYELLDVLGDCHRKVLFEPKEGTISILHRKLEGSVAAGPSDEQVFEDFSDPSRRLLTGASLLFRNAELMAHLRKDILPELIPGSPQIHVWCAGCSIGMEAYTVAMIIREWLSARGVTVEAKVLGSDISQEALDVAIQGEYPVSQQTRAANVKLLARYAESIKNQAVRMKPEVRKMVFFRKRDIRAGTRHPFEIVICDHVLQYFTVDVQLELINSLARAVRPGGFFYVSTPSGEVLEILERQHPFKRLARNLYRRNGA